MKINNHKIYNVIIIGGGASGFFTAINLAKKAPHLNIVILEKNKDVLNKVKISGGGRCNVTNSVFDPINLASNYPRGEKELLGPFHSFMTGDTIQWFEDKGVNLKIEDDGRVFPESDSSQSIIDCFQKEVDKHNIKVITSCVVKDFAFAKAKSQWQITTKNTSFFSNYLVVATGSSLKVWNNLTSLGHSIVHPVPSLFTFNIKDKRIENLMGLSTDASVKVLNSNLESDGPLLITHWGMSGPAILKLSAWGARELNKMNYNFEIQVNWTGHLNKDEVYEELQKLRQSRPKKSPFTHAQFDLPKRLWMHLLKASSIKEAVNWADLSNNLLSEVAKQLTEGVYQVTGKSTFKEEFVTAGGVDLKEINFKTFESKLLPNIYMAGEVLNIDAITGGFNFQNAWTGGYLIAQAIADKEAE